MADIKAGDAVKLTGKFLQSTGQQASAEGRKRWTVLARSGSFAVVNEPTDTSIFTSEELAEDPSLKWRRINVGNLMLCSGGMVRRR